MSENSKEEIVRDAENKINNAFSTDLLDVFIDELEINEKVRQIKHEANCINGTDKIVTLLRAVTFVDLTSLGGNDTAVTIEKLCKKALNPIDDLKFNWDEPLHTAAVCVYPLRIQDAIKVLQNSDVKHNISVASVAAGFPSGQYPLETRLGEIYYAAKIGAKEIDIVINRPLALEHKWKDLYNELRTMRKACNTTCMKTILATGELFNYYNVYKASMVAMMAGSDFIKTSTGKETVNATLSAGIVMCKAIKDYYAQTGKKVGFKPAGGIKTASDILEWMTLINKELDDSWLNKKLFRIGASSVLDSIANEINCTISCDGK
ncbi:deoxyribose-phosphate aldolase [Vespa velutina]|uniref:deoxyribose-phosphate aldolase n=1 Tax=Vespa velutina TaxID=202808 RepID=UPI001FB2C273|nr:deoxyribose-phosphate aldolase [Vespa velutina]XP_047350961.1 deoxyribose-phosphate aldolase [Vespa velutina]